MNPLNKLQSRDVEVCEELFDIYDGEGHETLKTANGVFNHKEWLEAEHEALKEETDRVTGTINKDGEFIGAKH